MIAHMAEPRAAQTSWPALPSLFACRYRLGDVIGRGAIAEVVRAVDVTSGRPVALKFLYPSLHADTAVVERFKREVALVRRISQAHVLRIDHLLEADGRLALVMELRHGGDLATRLARGGPLPAPTVLAILRQVGGALAAAHRVGIIHRDVKPQNILIGPDRDPDCRVCDFGLARTTDASRLTTHSMVLGTPEYMAPEVILYGYADLRSDLYALGAVAFQALTGRVPFDGDSPYTIFHQHLEAPPPPLRALAPDVPPGLEAAIERALEKDPLSRFGSAEEMLAVAEGRVPGRSTAGAAAPLAAAAFAVEPCAGCGGRVYARAGACADCGAARLRLVAARPGVAVMVRGPGTPGHRLDAREHVALVKLLRELPADACETAPPATRPSRLPFYVARGLDLASAEELLARLGTIGLAATIEPSRRLRKDPDMRKKVRATARAYLVFNSLLMPVLVLLEHHHPGAIVLAQLAGLAMAPLVAGRAARRPLVTAGAGPDRGDAATRIARVLRAPVRREERRLLARLLDRLAAIRLLDDGAGAGPLAERAAAAAEGLARVVELNAADMVVAGEADEGAEDGLARLREAERVRVALVADLLRSAERVERLSLQLARLGTAEAAADVTAAEADLEGLQAEIVADLEIDEMLR
jgi:serine/threonine-protein kinase